MWPVTYFVRLPAELAQGGAPVLTGGDEGDERQILKRGNSRLYR